MKRTFIALCAAAMAFVSCSEKENWRYLLDENLSNFEIYQSFEFTTPEYHGYPLDENGERIPQIGYNKNYKDLFTIDMVDGEPILHVNGMTYGCVFTKEEFSNYILNLKVKFGENTYHPRKNLAKDSGLLYHSQGEGGIDYWYSWKRSEEFQIQEGGTREGNYGDWWAVGPVRCTVKSSNQQGRDRWYDPEGERFIFGTGGDGANHVRVPDYGLPHGEWNDITLVCYGDKSVHIVNGNVVMALENLEYLEDGELHRLDHGQIQLQSEGAECYYKQVRIRPIDSMPAEYAALFE